MHSEPKPNPSSNEHLARRRKSWPNHRVLSACFQMIFFSLLRPKNKGFTSIPKYRTRPPVYMLTVPQPTEADRAW